jgi:hypothetical protein
MRLCERIKQTYLSLVAGVRTEVWGKRLVYLYVRNVL